MNETAESGSTAQPSHQHPGESSPTPAQPLASAIPERSFGPPTLVGKGGNAEASLALGARGLALACSHGAFEKTSPSWVSRDGGDTFEPLDPSPSSLPSGDCDFAIASDGTWYAAFSNAPPTGTVAVSRDEGKSWTTTLLAAVGAGGAVDRPWLVAGPGGTVFLSYISGIGTAGPHAVVMARSDDHGASWTDQAPVALPESPERPHHTVSRPVVSDDGTVILIPMVAMNGFTGGAQAVSIARSEDGGITWSRDPIHVVDSVAPITADLARASDGTLALAYVAGTGPDPLDIEQLVGVSPVPDVYDVVLRSSRDEGAQWSNPIVIATGVKIPGVGTVALDAVPTGGFALAWQHVVDGGWTVAYARVGSDGALPRIHDITTPARSDQHIVDIPPALRHDEEGRAQIVYALEDEECAEGRGGIACVWLVRQSG